MRSSIRSSAWWLVFGAFSIGCASAPPPSPKPKPTEKPRELAGPVSVDSEIGGLNQDAIDETFADMQREVIDCIQLRTTDMEFLGGDLTLSLRIAKDGSLRWAYLKASTLGHRDAEKCVLDAARAHAWPKPVGGEGLAEKSFSIEALAHPHIVEAKHVKPVVKTIRKQTATCRQGVPGNFMATLYLDRTGRVLAAGVAPPDEHGEEVADCFVEQIRKLNFGKLQQAPVKLSVDIL